MPPTKPAKRESANGKGNPQEAEAKQGLRPLPLLSGEAYQLGRGPSNLAVSPVQSTRIFFSVDFTSEPSTPWPALPLRFASEKYRHRRPTLTAAKTHHPTKRILFIPCVHKRARSTMARAVTDWIAPRSERGITITAAAILHQLERPPDQHPSTRLGHVDFTDRSGSAPCGARMCGCRFFWRCRRGPAPVGKTVWAAGRSLQSAAPRVRQTMNGRTGANLFSRSTPDQGSP